MTNPTFSRPGAVDLSGLAQGARQGHGSRSGGAGGATARSWVLTDVGEADLEDLIRRSVQYPVVLELTSARAGGADQLSRTLADLANAAQGRWLLAQVDCDAHPQIASALQVQAVPTVLALVGGQALPLFQGVPGHDDVKKVIDQVLQTALANGIAGHAEPVAVEEAPQAAAPRDPRYAAGDAALAAGRYQEAEQAYDALLADSPADAEARRGRARAALGARVSTLDVRAVEARIAADPEDPSAVLDRADLLLASGHPDEAFAGITALLRRSSGEARETLRVRLVELFDTLDPADPALAKARRDLATALF